MFDITEGWLEDKVLYQIFNRPGVCGAKCDLFYRIYILTKNKFGRRKKTFCPNTNCADTQIVREKKKNTKHKL